MQAYPSSPKELIENVILLTIAIHETGPDDVHTQQRILLTKGQRRLLQLLLNEVLREWDPSIILVFAERLVVVLGGRLAPRHG